MQKYDHKNIEKKWQDKWEEDGVYKTSDDLSLPKKYILDMFPYPSGEGLHVGHPRGYIATDVYSRMMRMNGYNVLHPMGFDAFGLPAENFAIKNKVHPRVAVEKNVARFKEQLSLIGFDYDWTREINTTDPEFYKWTQWMFIKMYEKGLAYESYEPINWCPVDKTGLANEDVEADGTCERCGAMVEKKPMRQWVLKITDYADRLLLDLDKLPKWPEGVKEAQRNWIGKSEGAEIEFSVKNSDEKIKVFTTRADTIFGATFLAVAGVEDKFTGKYAINPASGEEIPVWEASYVLPEYGTGAIMGVPAHDERDYEFAKKNNLPIKRVVEPIVVYTEGESAIKEGEPFTKRENVCVVIRNPKDDKYLCINWKNFNMHGLVTGGIENNEEIIECAKREIIEETGYKNIELVNDPKFAMHTKFFHRVKKQNRHARFQILFFDLINEERADINHEDNEIHEIVWKNKNELKTYFTVAEGEYAYKLIENSNYIFDEYGILNESGEFSGLSSEEAREEIIKKVNGKKVINYKIKDWVFSRQRYWGEPIPMVHCDGCGVVPVDIKDLPIKLPEVENYEPSGTGESPLANIIDWINTKCPKCAGDAKRETNTMPQWAGSSWYYLRYIDPKNDSECVDKDKEKYFMTPYGVDVYVGGDHATRHLIYARFWHKFLFDIGVVSTEEPFPRLEFLGFILAPDGRKMSKRWGNVINPDDMVERFGADAFRLYTMFIGPFENTVPFNEDGMVGTYRFLERVWKAAQNVLDFHGLTLPGVPGGTDIKENKEHFASQKILHKTIKKVSEDIENFKFNTAVSTLMIFMNEVKIEEISSEDFKKFLQILAPFAPHVAEELWHSFGEENSIHISSWPKYDEGMIVDEEVKIIIQVNGKVRGEILVGADESEDEIKNKALENEQAKKYFSDQEIKKVIYVKGRLINIVI